MKKKMIKSALMHLCAGAIVFTSCSKGDETPEKVPVRFTSLVNKAETPVAGISKASGSAWTMGDAIGIYMLGNSIDNCADNRKHATVTGSSVFAPAAGHEIYYPVDGSNVDFAAYYPYNASQSGMSYAVNVATQTSQPTIDLLWAKIAGKSKTSGDVALVFDHKLAKVVVNIVQPSTLNPNNTGLTDADLANLTVTIKGMNTTAVFDLSTGELPAASYGNITAITFAPITMGMQYEAIVLPAAFVTAGSVRMEFALNNARSEVFTWNCPANELFSAGSVHTYDMTVTRTGVDFTCTINQWDTTPAERIGTAE